jgi:uncharacterized HAD superfamily protein
LYSALPCIRESVQAIELIKKLGYKIIILTARPEQYRIDTEISFAMHKIPYDEIIFEADKPKQINRLARTHSIVAFADDRLEHVVDIYNTDKVNMCFLLNKPSNLHKEIAEDIIRINDLLELVRLLPEV